MSTDEIPGTEDAVVPVSTTSQAMERPWFTVGADVVKLLRDGAEAFPAMLDAIAKAEREILLEMYWVGADACGVMFRDALTERAKAGVTVRVIWDSIGSLGTNESWWQPLVAAGGDVREYHALLSLTKKLELDRIERRDHRKLLVVDAAIGFTGGIKLSNQWMPVDQGG
jgi:cardiolipin synthase